jgi:hypothetical protein
MERDDEEQAIEEFMGENPRAEEWTALRQSLKDRLKALKSERATATVPEAIRALDKRIAIVAEQVAALETEEVVARFVEESVRATLRGSMAQSGSVEME